MKLKLDIPNSPASAWLAVVFSIGVGCLAAAQTKTGSGGALKEPAAPSSRTTQPAAGKKRGTLQPSARRVVSARPIKMYYYLDDARALESLRAHASEMTVLSLAHEMSG